MALAAGTKLEPYEILSPIRAGGMGEVYRARDRRLERDVAIKVLSVFRRREGDYGFAYRVHLDATGLKRLVEYPVIETRGVSPDGKWRVAYVRYAPPGEETAGAILAFPLEGGAGVYLFKLGGRHTVACSADQRMLYLSLSAESSSRTYAFPLALGRDWPEIPKTGFQAADIAKLPGVRVIDAPEVAAGATSAVYAFSRETIQRNLYRIPVP